MKFIPSLMKTKVLAEVPLAALGGNAFGPFSPLPIAASSPWDFRAPACSHLHTVFLTLCLCLFSTLYLLQTLLIVFRAHLSPG